MYNLLVQVLQNKRQLYLIHKHIYITFLHDTQLTHIAASTTVHSVPEWLNLQECLGSECSGNKHYRLFTVSSTLLSKSYIFYILQGKYH